MRTICAYCHNPMHGDDDTAEEGARVSHGMCDACFAYFDDQWDGLSLTQFIERFEAPILVVDEAGRVAAINSKATAGFGVYGLEAVGLLGGDLMECQYARLPGGCGQTVHCAACTIRNLVNKTFESRETHRSKPCYLERVGGTRIDLVITTRVRDGLVVLGIESMVEAGGAESGD